ncbi:FG-GAP-like repeat-containing protein [Teredinibacter turnerae]|uniref:FG-GAP-like repeat-containing protein n=1 Tax=Teredinibacter turnerae TaxID=2426 RepID=UPI00040F2E2E|nr:FG-GAP-like repeat-containing protein [Teredinibacter turnerae]
MKIFHAACLFFLYASSCIVEATELSDELSPGFYDIYYGDANSDGYSDIYFHPKDRYVLLHGEVVIPILLPSKSGFLLSSVDYPNYTNILEFTLTKDEIMSRQLVLAYEGVDYFYGNFDGNEGRDILVRGANSISPSILISGNNQAGELPTIANAFVSDDFPAGYDLSDRSNPLKVVDANGDGIDDLMSATGNFSEFGYIGGNGNLDFQTGRDFRLATTKAGVGATPLQYSVNPDGTSSVSVDIASQEGVGGLQPTVSLNYSSGSGDGHTGIGWAVSGLSAIQRCPSSIEFGGVNDAVDFDGNDKFCLDGQPLVAIAGVYGDDQTEYRTRAESFLKIISYGSVGSCIRNGINVPGPQRFKVWLPTGEIREYGFTNDSRIEANGCSDVIRWAINKENDRYGNAIEYRYIEEAYDHYIDSISYNAGVSRIEFEYDDRIDSNIVYAYGTKRQQTKLLSKVSSLEAESLLREYHLKYELIASSSISRLIELVECSATECLPATVFNWSADSTNSTIAFGTRISSTICADDSTAYGKCNDKDNNPYIYYPDINGDALQDVCFRSDSGIRCKLGTPEGFTGTYVSSSICANDSTLYGQCNDEDNYKTIRFVDVDADGKSDLVFRSDAGLRVMRSTGTGFVSYISSSICANGSQTNGVCNDIDNWYSLQYPDLNGDGLADVCYRGDEGINCFLGTGTGFDGAHISSSICANESPYYGTCDTDDNYSTITFADLDLDGNQELVVRTDSGIRSWRLIGNSFRSHIISSICKNESEANGICNDEDNYKTIQYPDITGDGVPDLCYRGDEGIQCFIGTGYGWTGGQIITDICANKSNSNGRCNDDDNYRTISFNDINQDGRQDLLIRSDYGIYVFKSTGTDFQYLFHRVDICANDSTLNGVCNDENNHDSIRVIDFNGDGLPDLVYRGDDGIQLFPILKDQQNLLVRVVNGFGVDTKFTYKKMTDPSVYAVASDDVLYPVKQAVHSGKLVSKLETSDGIGGYNAKSYFYKGLKFHLAGQGVLGFAEFIEKNDDTGITTRTLYSQDYEQHSQGMEKEIFTTASNGTLLLHTELTTSLATWGAGDSLRYQLRASTSTSTERDLDGEFLNKTIIRTKDYDSYGAARTVVNEVYNEQGQLVRNTTAATVFDHDSINWFLGRVKRMTSTTTVAGRPKLTKVSSWEYDPLTSRMTAEKIHNPQTDAVLHETRYGEDEAGNSLVDAFGNNLAITVKGPDFESRTSRVSFDTTGRRVLSKTDARGLTIRTDYYAVDDYSIGAYPNLPRSVTDINNQKVFTAYDSFGRVVTSSMAWGTPIQQDAITEYRLCDQTCPDGAVYYISSSGDGGGETRGYLDSVGRTILKKSQVIRDDESAPVWVNTEYKFDHLGRNYKVSEPYFEGDTVRYWTEQKYDALDRVTAIINPNGRIDENVYSGYLLTSKVDIYGKNHSSVNEINVLNELIKVTDNKGYSIEYTYDSLSNLLTTKDPQNNVVAISYNALGMKQNMDDPDKGGWSYTYNGLGQLITQKNARGEVTCNAYDISGRLVKRVENYAGATSTTLGQISEAKNQCAGDDSNPDVAEWIYDSAQGAALGLLHRTIGKDGYVEELFYDVYGRPVESVKTVNGESYRMQTSYDEYSRPYVSTYPGESNRLMVKNIYNQLGALKEIRNASNDALYYRVKAIDARGSVVSEIFGNGVVTSRTYADEDGELKGIRSGIGFPGTEAQNLGFDHDSLGNLKYREDFKNNFSETFVYDEVNRLKSTTANYGNGEIRNISVDYDPLGNIVEKTGVGSYKYGSQCVSAYGPHAVCEIAGVKNAFYKYDLNGNMTSGDGRTIKYTVFDKPYEIRKGNNLTEINYGPNRSRYFRRDTTDIGVVEHTYIGAYEKVEYFDDGANKNKTEERHYIGGFAILTTEGRTAQSSGSSKIRYLHKDHLGSITGITDEIGSVVEEFSFDPWGKRRAVSLDELEFYHGPWATLGENEKNNTATNAYMLSSFVTNRGFTGHEQMDPVGLIHMNGRVYDAELGRFIQADPIIQSSGDLQSYNRYAYVRNNPLNLVDPSGFNWVSKAYNSARSFGVKAWHFQLRTNVGYLTSRAIEDETNRATIRIHEWNKGWTPILENIDSYLAGHAWARIVVVAVVGFFSGGSAVPAMIAMMAAQKHMAYTQGATATQMTDVGITAAVTSVVASEASAFLSSSFSSYVTSSAVAGVAANFVIQRAVGYAVSAAANDGHFGKFKGYMVSWARSAAISWVVGQVAGGIASNFVRKNGLSSLATGAKAKVAFVGGFFDETIHGPVISAYEEYIGEGGDATYFTWDQGGDLSAWIDSNSGYAITVIGHSYGGDTAATIVSKGHKVSHLITVDPVGWTRPNYSSVAANSGKWTNYNAVGGGRLNFSNIVAGIGGAWNNAPVEYVTQPIDAKYDHADVCYYYCKP